MYFSSDFSNFAIFKADINHSTYPPVYLTFRASSATFSKSDEVNQEFDMNFCPVMSLTNIPLAIEFVSMSTYSWMAAIPKCELWKSSSSANESSFELKN